MFCRFTLKTRVFFITLAFVVWILTVLQLAIAPTQQLRGAQFRDAYASHVATYLQYGSIWQIFDQQRPIERFWQRLGRIYVATKPETAAIEGFPAIKYHGASEYRGDRQPGPSMLQLRKDVVQNLSTAHAHFLEFVDQLTTQQDMYEGDGIVMSAGGKYFGNAIIGLKMIRRTGSTLPIEIFVANEQEYERQFCEKVLPKFNARCIIMSELLRLRGLPDHEQLKIHKFQYKSLAILFSSFENVLSLDSDSFPIRNPEEEFFGQEPFLSKGLVLWPDFWTATEDPVFYTITGLDRFPTGLPIGSSEAGQLLVNKRTHLKSLLLATYYNIYGPSHYYPLLSQGALGQGDKETFLAAAVVLNQSYYHVKRGVTAQGYFNPENQGKFHGSAMIQYHPGDDYNNKTEGNVRPAFIHANFPKLNPSALVESDDIQSHVTGRRFRLYGPADSTIKAFGSDIEKVIFGVIVQTVCDIGDILEEFRRQPQLCEKMTKHYEETFMPNERAE